MSGDEDAKTKAERQLREQVAALGVKFLQRTRDQATALRELLVGLSNGDESVLAQMQELSHKIHGSGAMFGFEEVSRVAMRQSWTDAWQQVQHRAHSLKPAADSSRAKGHVKGRVKT